MIPLLVSALKRLLPGPLDPWSRLSASAVVTVLLVIPATVHGQYETRAEKITAERQARRNQATPARISTAESRLNEIEDKKVLERLAFGYHGLSLALGGLESGQGFALGPRYLRTDFRDGRINVRSSARYAFSQAYVGDAILSFPRLASDTMFLEVSGVHRNYPRIEYYGRGPESAPESRTHYRLEDTAFRATLGFRPTAHLAVGVRGGSVFVNTGPGNISPDVRPRTEDVFAPIQLPGIEEQTSFLEAGVWAQFDYRDNPLGARSGGNYLARLDYAHDRELDRHDFRRLDLEAQQYIPFFARRRVLVLRVKASLTFTNGAATVPFYLQPVLGGSDDLRGFRSFRFHDDQMIVSNIEYRWESFSGLDMALFFDAGKVARRPSDIDFSDLESSVGFGVRFNVRNATFIRIDTGFSHEGARIWLKFANPF
jgi:hypothetical protein